MGHTNCLIVSQKDEHYEKGRKNYSLIYSLEGEELHLSVDADVTKTCSHKAGTIDVEDNTDVVDSQDKSCKNIGSSCRISRSWRTCWLFDRWFC